MSDLSEKSSFRDNSGRVIRRNNILLREINRNYKDNFDYLMSSGLYQKLVSLNLLIPHEETDIYTEGEIYKIIRPEEIPFISYPYEWCFSQLKDAALLTLEIQRTALSYGMVLKDASAYNVQFYHSKPIFIDTLSFAKYNEGQPWVAYRQFCQHFVAPLLLMSKNDIRHNCLLKTFIDGIPLDFLTKQLPFKCRFNIHILTNVYIHAKAQVNYNLSSGAGIKVSLGKQQLINILNSLHALIEGLSICKQSTQWEKYYSFTNYTNTAFEFKKSKVESFIDQIKPRSVLDLGANTGVFSRIASSKGIYTISTDFDGLAVEKNYQLVKKQNEQHILPITIDLTNPTPAIGWENCERTSFSDRANVDMVMALALVHHLAITNNIPLGYIAEYFSKLGRHLIIEFVPKSDSQVVKLLQHREDIFLKYNETDFELEFGKYFEIIKKEKVIESERIIYLMARR